MASSIMCLCYDFLLFDEEDVCESVRRRRIINIRPNYFDIYDDLDFTARFRLSKDAVVEILNKISHWISPPSNRNYAVPAMKRLLLALRFYATGNMLLATADFSGVSKTSACDFVRIVSEALSKLRGQYIKMPENNEAMHALKINFHAMARVPNVIGAIDCTHIRIRSPGGEDAEVFRNPKGYMSLNVQTISDHQMKIQDIVARWPGSVHDQTIFDNSRIKRRFEMGVFGTGLLIGDAGYMNTNYLITPLTHVTSAAETLYNEAVTRTRNVVERQYGLWKRRFPILHLEMRVSVRRVQAIIVACAVLHNIAIERNEEMPSEDDDDPWHEEAVNDDIQNVGRGNDGVRRRLINNHFNRLGEE